MAALAAPVAVKSGAAAAAAAKAAASTKAASAAAAKAAAAAAKASASAAKAASAKAAAAKAVAVASKPTAAAAAAAAPAAAAKPAAAAAAAVAASAVVASPAAAPAASDAVSSAAVSMPTMAARYEGWLTVVADPLERYLLWLQGAFRSAGVPYPQGASIIALTACVKLATFPFTKKQVESGLSMQNLNPQIKALRERWAGDENSAKLNSELSALYKRYGVNPLAGCIPTLTTLPVFWGLYRALLNGSADGAFKEPFWFVPSLAGPTYVPFAGNTGGLSWLWPLNADGVPPIGWDQAQAYLILPVALVVSQYIATVLVPPTPPDEDAKEDDNAKTTKAVLKLLPLMVGYFSLTLPAGMGLYWLANNVFTTATTYYLKNLGGAQTPVPKLERPKLKLGTAIRSGGGAEEGEAMAADMMAAVSAPPVAADVAQPAAAAVASAVAPAVATEVEAPVAAAASAPVPAPAAAAAQPAPAAAEAAAAVLAARMPRRCKRAKDPAKRKPATGRPPLAA